MEDLNQIETRWTAIADEFQKSFGCDSDGCQVCPDGVVRQFSGAPFVGEKYGVVRPRIMFVGLDIGADEGNHNFATKRGRYPESASALNPHLAGVYAATICLLRNVCFQDVWELLSANEKWTVKQAIRGKVLPSPKCEVFPYVCITNAYRFVTKDRQHRAGGNDRKGVSRKEIEFLGKEIAVLQPDVIIFHGGELSNIKSEDLGIDPLKVKRINMMHPAARKRLYRSIEYIKSKIIAG